MKTYKIEIKEDISPTPGIIKIATEEEFRTMPKRILVGERVFVKSHYYNGSALYYDRMETMAIAIPDIPEEAMKKVGDLTFALPRSEG